MLNYSPRQDWHLNRSLMNHVSTEIALNPFRQIEACYLNFWYFEARVEHSHISDGSYGSLRKWMRTLLYLIVCWSLVNVQCFLRLSLNNEESKKNKTCHVVTVAGATILVPSHCRVHGII